MFVKAAASRNGCTQFCWKHAASLHPDGLCVSSEGLGPHTLETLSCASCFLATTWGMLAYPVYSEGCSCQCNMEASVHKCCVSVCKHG